MLCYSPQKFGTYNFSFVQKWLKSFDCNISQEKVKLASLQGLAMRNNSKKMHN